MANDGKGYLFPIPANVEELRCIRIWIPDHDLYLYALAGSVQYLTTWRAWAMDDSHNARIAALAWWNAWNYTQEHGWLDCGDEEPPEGEDVTTINNYVNCGGGCGCGDGTDVPVYTPPGGGNPIVLPFPTLPGEDPSPPPPATPTEPPPPYFPDDPNWEDRAQWEAARCRIANYGWRVISNFLYNMEQVDNRIVQIGVILGIFIAYAPAAILARIGASQLMYLVAAIGEITAVTGAWSAFWGAILGWWESHQNEIVCWAVDAFDATALSETLLGEMTETLHDEWEALPGWTTAMVDAAVRALIMLFNPGVASFLYNFTAPEYTTIEVDCATCGETEFFYELRDKDGGLISTHGAFTGTTNTITELQNTPGSGGGNLILLRFYNADMEFKNVTGNLTAVTGHNPPTNTNHPFTIQYSIQDGPSNVVLIPLNNSIPVPTEIDGYHHFYIHGLDSFSVSFVIDSIAP